MYDERQVRGRTVIITDDMVEREKALKKGHIVYTVNEVKIGKSLVEFQSFSQFLFEAKGRLPSIVLVAVKPLGNVNVESE